MTHFVKKCVNATTFQAIYREIIKEDWKVIKLLGICECNN